MSKTIPGNLPLPTTRIIYVGEDNECHVNGETYTVIETGFHWIKELGYVIWVTTEEYKDTTDIDYGMSCSIDYFKGNFITH